MVSTYLTIHSDSSAYFSLSESCMKSSSSDMIAVESELEIDYMVFQGSLQLWWLCQVVGGSGVAVESGLFGEDEGDV